MRYYLIYLFFAIMVLAGCKKFLDEKPDLNRVQPSRAEDLYALLDNAMEINGKFTGFIEMGCDDYTLNASAYSELSAFYQDVYVWKTDLTYTIADITLQWLNAYIPIMTANVVEESLDRLDHVSETDRKLLKGRAFFVKGLAYSLLAQTFAEPFNARDENLGKGIIWRNSSDPNEKSVRLNVAESFERIIALLEEAAQLLPESVSDKTKPSKEACYAVLSRIYLWMQNYEQSLFYSGLALALNNHLMDYSKVDGSPLFPFTAMNEETLYFAYCNSSMTTLQNTADVSGELYDSYEEDDLRKTLYFYEKSPGQIGFRGHYMGMDFGSFVGPTVAELYLIKAECQMRNGNIDQGMLTMRDLLENRWRKNADGTSALKLPSFSLQEDALHYILKERRKELVFRGARWADLRRLNLDKRFAVTIERTIDMDGKAVKYKLPPNDSRYTYRIPREVEEKLGSNGK